MSTLMVGSPVCEEWPVTAELGGAAAQPKANADARRPALTRRRPNREQGIALEKLGHAIEYLIDSSMARCEGVAMDAQSPEFEAARIMMRLNCEVFADCEPVVPIHKRICRALGFRR
ncbi:MAG: hypothetical protein P4L87_05285 [Formivibrio sp.]|nr:hypothetical protein [Formivibrio sp.]